MAEAPPSARLLHIDRTSLTHHYNVKDGAGQQLFYCDVSTFTPKKPDLTIHAGPDAKAPIVAISYLHHLSSEMQVGLGDPSNADKMVFEDLVRDKFFGGEYHFETATAGGQRKKFCWKRTHSEAVDGNDSSLWTTSNFKLVDPTTDDIVAIFTSSRSPTKAGDLQLNVQHGQEFDLMVTLTCISIYEKARRRRHHMTAGGGAGTR